MLLHFKTSVTIVKLEGLERRRSKRREDGAADAVGSMVSRRANPDYKKCCFIPCWRRKRWRSEADRECIDRRGLDDSGLTGKATRVGFGLTREATVPVVDPDQQVAGRRRCDQIEIAVVIDVSLDHAGDGCVEVDWR